VITIVTISLNDEVGIQRTFESLREQNYRDVQHLIIDGGSTDGTPVWAAEHAVFDHTVIISERDRGIYDAMNKGLSMATGELVCFLNSGDQFANGDILSTITESHKKDSWPWAYGFGRMVMSDGRTSAGGRVRRKHSWLRQTFWSYEICHPTVFMPPDLARRLGGFDDRLRIAADYKLMTSAGRVAEPHVFPMVMAVTIEGGISDLRPADAIREAHKIRVDILGMTDRAELLDLVWSKIMLVRSLSRRRLSRFVRRNSSAIDGPPGRARSHN